MSFLNTFIGLSILAEEAEQTDELEYHTALLKRQNEEINSLVRHNQEQDWIRDYMYRINKLCEKLENSSEKDSLDYYYSIFCIGKGINESGITISSISELRDKEYFDRCLDRIEKLIFEFGQKHQKKLSEYNSHIKNIEDDFIFSELKESEDARYRVFKINERIKDYEFEMGKKGWRSLLGFFPIGGIAILGVYLRINYSFYIPFVPYLNDVKYYGICAFLGFLALMTGKIIGKECTLKAIKKQKNPLSEEEYKKLIQERTECEQKILKDRNVYAYAKTEFPEFNFWKEEENPSVSKSAASRVLSKEQMIEDYTKSYSEDKSYESIVSSEIERLHIVLQQKDDEIAKSFGEFSYSLADIRKMFYLRR